MFSKGKKGQQPFLPHPWWPQQALGAQMFFVTRGAGGWQRIRTEMSRSKPPLQGLRASAPVSPAVRPGWGRAAAVSSLEQHFPTVWRSDTWLSHIPAPAGPAALGQESRRREGWLRLLELLISRFRLWHQPGPRRVKESEGPDQTWAPGWFVQAA